MRVEYNLRNLRGQANPYAKTLKKRRPSIPITVKKAVRTCRWCPSLWEGMTVDGRPIYARYRHGCLSVRVGKQGGSMDDAVRSGKLLLKEVVGDDLDGFMTYADLKHHTKKLILWPPRAGERSC